MKKTRAERLTEVRTLLEQGLTAAQISTRLGIGSYYVSQLIGLIRVGADGTKGDVVVNKLVVSPETEGLRKELAQLKAELAAVTAGGDVALTINLTREGVLENSTKVTGRQHPKFQSLIRAAACRMSSGFVPGIMMVGPTGTGKSYAAKKVAEALGLPFFVASMMSEAYQLMGYMSPDGTYNRTLFREAFEFGGVILLDEVDAWDAQATLALNGALANDEAAFPDGMVKRHKDCVVVCAANTWGQGATSEFTGRTKLDAAFLSRFPIKLDWHRDDAVETMVAGNAEFTARVQRARAKAAQTGLKVVIDPRHSMAGAALIAAGFSHDEAARMTYLAGLTVAQVALIEG